MVLNAAMQMLREADELKGIISKFKNGTSMLQEQNLWATQQQLQKIYQKVLVMDLDYALDKKVEQDLWNIGFKQQIEALQAITQDRKNPLRSKAQAMLSWVLQAAAGFYLCLLHQICTTFKLDLPFRRRASLLGCVEGWGAGAGGEGVGARLPAPASACYICQHCLVHLGDLARYKQQMRLAHTFYRHALVVCVHSGQPYNQLALVAWRRARRLAALYWHVRSVLVRAPFPPAPQNLARTLKTAALAERSELPVLGDVTSPNTPAPAAPTSPQRLDSHTFVTELIRALHAIYTGDDLDLAESLVKTLNSSLITLIATDSFESSTLIKMTVVLIWLIHTSTEDLKLLESEATEGEKRAASLALSLGGGALLALLVGAYTVPLSPRVLPALKVWLEWTVTHSAVARHEAWRALYPALAHNLNQWAAHCEHTNKYAKVPLPEDEELHGFLPLEGYLTQLRFPNHAVWDTFGARLPDPARQDTQSQLEVASCLVEEPELQKRIRAHRVVELGKKLADIVPQHLTYTVEAEAVEFTCTNGSSASLESALRSAAEARGAGGGAALPPDTDSEGESDDERPRFKAPTVISEADFREKVREKRAGILKPQGSLERAREERALLTQDELDDGSEDSKFEDKKELRKPRVNIAMAAIMRKQEETNKQVKFVTPPPVAETPAETDPKEKPKLVQPKAIKSLADLPLGRKTGGILSLKDKSGYPHLVNAEPEKKEKEEKIEQKPSEPTQPYQQNRQELPHSPTWPASTAPTYNEPRMNFQKNYGIHNTGLSYNPSPPTYSPRSPSYQSPSNQGIRLPVINPKEIDVRSAALQKQNSRQEMFQDGHKLNYQVSGDKKNFLNDLPPRFANQYRYWQAAQENQFNDNKFRDDNFRPGSNFNQARSNWPNQPENFQPPPAPWWKPDNPPPNPNFNYSAPMNTNYFPPQIGNNIPNPYQNMSNFNQLRNIAPKAENSNYLNLPSTIGQPMQTLQSLVTSPNFNSSLTNFSSYPPAVPYDAAMYPQFNNVGYRPLQIQKPPGVQDRELMDLGVGFGNHAELKHRMGFGEMKNDMDASKMDPTNRALDSSSGEAPTNTYSLFSGAPNAASWGPAQNHPPQSLWSGPGPSPLERLLEQQKQLTQPPDPAQAPH